MPSIVKDVFTPKGADKEITITTVSVNSFEIAGMAAKGGDYVIALVNKVPRLIPLSEWDAAAEERRAKFALNQPAKEPAARSAKERVG